MRGLPWAVDEERLKTDCGALGTVCDSKLLMNEEGKSKGIAFISFTTKEAFDKCCEWNETEYEGRTVYVSEAESRPQGKGKGKGKGSDEKPENCTSLFLKNLKTSVEEDDLWTFFEDLETGPSRIKLLTDRDTGVSRGMAFVDFDDTDALDKAVARSSPCPTTSRRVTTRGRAKEAKARARTVVTR